jgi:hypothetical protein
VTVAEQHTVTASAAKVSIGAAGGNRVAVILRRGDVLPEGIADEQIKRLTERGLIQKVKTKAKVEEPDEGVYKGVSVKDLKAEIDKRNEGREDDAKVAPAEPGNRPEIVAALIADDGKQ